MIDWTEVTHVKLRYSLDDDGSLRTHTHDGYAPLVTLYTAVEGQYAVVESTACAMPYAVVDVYDFDFPTDADTIRELLKIKSTYTIGWHQPFRDESSAAAYLMMRGEKTG